MPQGEGVIINGAGSQLSTGHRWGDYTSMNVDPVDDCTFWYVNEYYQTNSTNGWWLRVGAFKFPTCGTGAPISDLAVDKTGEPIIVAPGGNITYTITAMNNGPDDLAPVTNTLGLTNTSGISITQFGAAIPYPSAISVPVSGTLVDVNVHLSNFSHTYPEDVNVLLVSPDDQNVMLMSDVGGSVDSANLNFTFDDSAGGYLPDGDVALVSGVYRPTDYLDAIGDDNFPAPAPAGPYGTLLSDFNGLTQTGDWNLYVYDDADGDAGSLAGGWSLALTYEFPGVTLTDTLPAGFYLSSMSLPAGWSCVANGQFLTCTSLTMPVGQVPIELYGTAPSVTGYITNTVEITAEAFDPNPANNSAAFPILVDTAPVAGDDAYNATEDVMLVVPLPGVLSNDNDQDGDYLETYLNTEPSFGSVAFSFDGSFEYTPDLDFNGTDSFTYLVDDGFLSDEATVVINVAAVNDVPVAGDDTYETDEDTVLVVPAPGLLANDEDVDGDALIPLIATPPANGELALMDDGSFVYTPTLNFNGQDFFAYEVWDGEFSDQAQVTITVTSINDDPFADAGEDQTADEGQEIVLHGTVGDPGLKLSPLADLEIAWDLGDGTLVTGTLTVTHTYVDDGLYTVTLTATDSEGGVGVDTLLVTVANVSPTLDELADQAGTVNEAVTLEAFYSDPGILDTQTVDFDWGDGLTETLQLAAGGSSFQLNHIYLQVGVFTVSVNIIDKDGGFDEQTFVVTVAPSTLFMFIPAVYK
jgi:subtilisin-like proprotein convertase family protein